MLSVHDPANLAQSLMNARYLRQKSSIVPLDHNNIETNPIVASIVSKSIFALVFRTSITSS